MRLTESARETIIAHARAEAPSECCGVLLGAADEIVMAVPGRNTADDPARRYLLDPQDHFNAIRAARQRGLEVVGFYHSHPRSAAEPSDTDRGQANYPRNIYLIVGLAEEPPALRAFRIADGGFVEEDLQG